MKVNINIKATVYFILGAFFLVNTYGIQAQTVGDVVDKGISAGPGIFYPKLDLSTFYDESKLFYSLI